MHHKRQLPLAAIVVLCALCLAAPAAAQGPVKEPEQPDQQPAWIPDVTLTKTVGVDPLACAATHSITLPPWGGRATYCYTVRNTGNTPLTLHTLLDDQLGTLLLNLPYTLEPDASYVYTHSVTVTTPTVNTATWVAVGAGQPASASDSASVLLATPSIAFSKTVGADPLACATGDELTLPPAGGQAIYCYTAENTGEYTASLHDLQDSELGSIFDGFPYDLLPGDSLSVTRSAVISATTVNTATWTARHAAGPSISVSDAATVTIEPAQPAIVLTKTVGLDPAACATTDRITVLAGTEVVYCYQVQNRGNIAFDWHDLYDDRLGALLFHWPYALAPGASVAITEAVPITATTANVGTWTAFSAGGQWATDGDGATVVVTPVEPNIVVDPTSFYLAQVPGMVTTPTLSIANTGLSTLTWDIQESLTPGCECLMDVGWLAATPISGTTPGAGLDTVDVTIDTTGLPFGEFYESAFCIHSNDPDPGPGNETGFVVVPVGLYTAVPVAVTNSELSAQSAAVQPSWFLFMTAVAVAGSVAAAAAWILRWRRRAARGER